MTIARYGSAVALSLFALTPVQAQNAATFVGSTAADAPILKQLGIASGGAELLEWKITLTGDHYTLRVDYGVTAPGQPGIARNRKSLDRAGTFTNAGNVYRLDGITLSRISSDVLHFRNDNGSLMAGNGGWSYTLHHQTRAEKPVSTADQNEYFSWRNRRGDSFTPASAPRPDPAAVHGAFDGRTPCQAIARELNTPVHPGCSRLKWGLTLLRDPATGNPTSYKLGGQLYWLDTPGATERSGTWSIERGRPGDPSAVVYRLSASGSERPLLLLKGDDNVLFMLDRNGNPLVGNADFSYTLDRKRAP